MGVNTATRAWTCAHRKSTHARKHRHTQTQIHRHTNGTVARTHTLTHARTDTHIQTRAHTHQHKCQRRIVSVTKTTQWGRGERLVDFGKVKSVFCTHTHGLCSFQQILLTAQSIPSRERTTTERKKQMEVTLIQVKVCKSVHGDNVTHY